MHICSYVWGRRSGAGARARGACAWLYQTRGRLAPHSYSGASFAYISGSGGPVGVGPLAPGPALLVGVWPGALLATFCCRCSCWSLLFQPCGCCPRVQAVGPGTYVPTPSRCARCLPALRTEPVRGHGPCAASSSPLASAYMLCALAAETAHDVNVCLSMCPDTSCACVCGICTH